MASDAWRSVSDRKNYTTKDFMHFLELHDYSAIRAFRRNYEDQYGLTDLDKRYISELPTAALKWLWKHEPEVLLEHLPPFGKAYLIEVLRKEVADNNLDEVSQTAIRLHANGYLRQDLAPS